MPMRIFGADVGSISKRRFAWAMVDPADAAGRAGGHDPSTLADRIKEELLRGELVALGFECPLVLPVPDLWDHLGMARTGEGSRAWAANAGASSMATGLVQLCWTLAQLATTKATTQPTSWDIGRPLLLWEAFVSGPGKRDRNESTEHLTDAWSAVQAFAQRLDKLSNQSEIHVGDHRPLNLAAVAALHAGLDIDQAEIALPLMVAEAVLPD
jgi:hypothetical protein